LVKLIKKCL